MQRIPLTTLRPLVSTTSSLRMASRLFAHSPVSSSTKQFSTNSVLNAFKNQRTKWGSATGIFARQASWGFQTEAPIVQRTQFSWQKFAWTAAGVAGTIIVADTVLNRDTRDALSAVEREYLNSSFKYTGMGVVLTAIAARAMFRQGLPFRIMAANPWLVLGVSLVGSVGSMMGVFYTAPENTVQKHLFWLAFNGFQAATLSPLFFISPAILSRAALYTIGVVGSLSYVGATANSLAPMVLPMGLRALAISESISLYGGLAVFSGFVLYDTQKILKHGRMVEAGVMKGDPLTESINLELDLINIFIRIVQILSMQNNRKK